MQNNVLLLDTETTGLDPSKGHRCIEIAALLYNLDHKVVLQAVSTFFPADENPVEHINNIKTDWLKTSYPWNQVFQAIKPMALMSSCIVAHNAEFDIKFVKTLTDDKEFWSVPWVCTKNDFQWPSRPSRLRLMDICESLYIPYRNAHRALSDCYLLAKCLSKVEDVKERFIKILKSKGVDCGNETV